MVRRASGPYAGRWTLPGGKVEPGERLADAVRREVREETSLEVEPGDVAAVREVIGDGHHFVIVVHHARPDGGRVTPGDDASEAAWWPLGQVDGLPTTDGLVPLLRAAGIV